MKHLLILITISLSVLYSEHSRTPILIPKETITEYDITITTGFYTYDRNYNAVPVWKNKPHDSGIYVLIEKNDVGIFYHEVEPRRTRWDVVPPMKLVDYIKFATIDRDVENPSGMTSFDEQHQHLYQVDSKGNGWALEAVNPRNPNIRHKHKIVNWEIQEAKSDCYPNCKMIYGHKGSGPHTHTINSTNEY